MDQLLEQAYQIELFSLHVQLYHCTDLIQKVFHKCINTGLYKFCESLRSRNQILGGKKDIDELNWLERTEGSRIRKGESEAVKVEAWHKRDEEG